MPDGAGHADHRPFQRGPRGWSTPTQANRSGELADADDKVSLRIRLCSPFQVLIAPSSASSSISTVGVGARPAKSSSCFGSSALANDAERGPTELCSVAAPLTGRSGGGPEQLGWTRPRGPRFRAPGAPGRGQAADPNLPGAPRGTPHARPARHRSVAVCDRARSSGQGDETCRQLVLELRAGPHRVPVRARSGRGHLCSQCFPLSEPRATAGSSMATSCSTRGSRASRTPRIEGVGHLQRVQNPQPVADGIAEFPCSPPGGSWIGSSRHWP